MFQTPWQTPSNHWNFSHRTTQPIAICLPVWQHHFVGQSLSTPWFVGDADMAKCFMFVGACRIGSPSKSACHGLARWKNITYIRAHTGPVYIYIELLNYLDENSWDIILDNNRYQDMYDVSMIPWYLWRNFPRHFHSGAAAAAEVAPQNLFLWNPHWQCFAWGLAAERNRGLFFVN